MALGEWRLSMETGNDEDGGTGTRETFHHRHETLAGGLIVRVP